jgi:hypothetical protein
MPPPDDDEKIRDDLAATSESLEADAREVVAIEEEKRDLEGGDPRLVDLSQQAERLARGIEDKSRIERDLSDRSVDGDRSRHRPPN